MMAGYHLSQIEKGEYGTLSKVREEFEELCDAVLQDNRIMALCEVADMIGALEGWLEQYAPGFSWDDIFRMKAATRRAFADGTRKPRT